MVAEIHGIFCKQAYDILEFDGRYNHSRHHIILHDAEIGGPCYMWPMWLPSIPVPQLMKLS